MLFISFLWIMYLTYHFLLPTCHLNLNIDFFLVKEVAETPGNEYEGDGI